MDAKSLEKRLRELGVYSEYWYRKELKALAPMLKDGEELYCVLTGVQEADRKMLAVTDRRLIIIFAGALGAGEVKVVAKSAVTEFRFEKKLLFSRVRFTAKGETCEFANTQGGQKELFEWAMKQPMKEQQETHKE